jgi:hypothetical protein
MTKGGARGRSGPAPDPGALRRDRDRGNWLILPAAGRPGDPPVWPLVRATKRELGLWAREWTRPQAIQWERNGQELEVALYVRTLAEAEKRGTAAALRTLLRQQQEVLGLSLVGLNRNRWIIGPAGPAEMVDDEPPAPERRPTGTEEPSARARLRLLAQ